MTNRQVACATDVTKAVLVIDNDREANTSMHRHVQGGDQGRAIVAVHIPCAQDWVKNIRCKLHNKNNYKEAFDAMYSILFLKAVGMSRDCAAAVQQAMCAFWEAFA
jgi:hypothetical protein